MDFGKYKNYLIVVAVLIVLYFLTSKNNKGNSNFEKFSTNNTTSPTLKLYYTNWCGWSQKFLPTWEKLEENIKDVKLVKIDCEQNKDMCAGIPGYPYLILEKGKEKISYNGDRSYEDVVKFINNN